MSDEFGFAAVAKTALLVFENGSRGTGRSARLVERVADGDQIIVTESAVSQHIQRLLREAGKRNVRVLVVGPNENPLATFGAAHRAPGRTLFDHTWVERHFHRAIELASRDLEVFQREMSQTRAPAPARIDDSAIKVTDWAVKNWGM